MTGMQLVAICRGSGTIIQGRRPYRSGIAKTPVAGPVDVTREGLPGDVIGNRKHHGGPDQALLIEGGIDRAFWQAELGRPLEPGAFGENLLIAGLDHRALSAGDRFEIGDVVLEVTSQRMPCSTFAAHLGLRGLVRRYRKACRPGAYVRVLSPGTIEAGMDVTFHPFAGERVSLCEMMETYGLILDADDRRRFLAAPIHAKLRAKLEADQAEAQ